MPASSLQRTSEAEGARRWFAVLTNVPRVPGRALAAFYATDLALVSFAIVVFTHSWLNSLALTTGGLVSETLLVNLFGLLVIGGGVLMRLGGLRPADVGLRPRGLPRAIGLTLLLWLAAQLGAVVVCVVSGGPVTWNQLWSTRGVTGVLGLLLAQVLGNALLEEVGYRGFLLPQLYAQLAGVRTPGRRLLLAVVASQALFALSHIPNRLWQGVAGGELLVSLAIVFALGVVLALLYLRTGNLWLVVGVHALMDAPTLLVSSPLGSEIVDALALVLLLVWSLLPRTTPVEHPVPAGGPARISPVLPPQGSGPEIIASHS